jgi:hypothetical protein
MKNRAEHYPFLKKGGKWKFVDKKGAGYCRKQTPSGQINLASSPCGTDATRGQSFDGTQAVVRNKSPFNCIFLP